MTSYLRSCYHCIRMYRGEVMAVVTVRNLPAETHRALRVRAARNGRSTEAEIREILEEAVRPSKRVKIGSELAAFGQSLWVRVMNVVLEPVLSSAAMYDRTS